MGLGKTQIRSVYLTIKQKYPSRQVCSASLIRTTAEELGLNSPNAWADGR
jgi:hypothetical protein